MPAAIPIDQLGYPGDNTPSDATAYACAYCGIGLYFNKMRFIPDDLCSRCYAVLKDYKEEPWLKFLITKEQSRHRKLLRYRKRGIDYQPISYEEYILTLPDIEL